MTSHPRQLLEVLSAWPLQHGWAQNEGLEGLDSRLQDQFWALYDELSAEDEDNDIEASGDPFWVKYVVDTACSLKGRYIDISDVRTIVSELKCLGVELPSRDIDGNMESEGAQLDLNYDLLKEFHGFGTYSPTEISFKNDKSTFSSSSSTGESDHMELSPVSVQNNSAYSRASTSGETDKIDIIPSSQHGAPTKVHSSPRRSEDTPHLFASPRATPCHDHASRRLLSTSSAQKSPVHTLGDKPMDINLNSPPLTATTLARGYVTRMSCSSDVLSTQIQPKVPHGWNVSLHSHLLMDFREIVCDKCVKEGAWCSYFVEKAGRRDLRRRLRCEHCTYRKQACSWERPTLPLNVREASRWGPLFITRTWTNMRHVVPAMSVITPIGQSPEVYETTKKKPGCLSKPIMYSGTSSQTFALDLPLSRSLSRDSSKSSGSNISTLDLGGLNVNELASLPQDSPFDWHVHFFPPLRNISEDLNILRLLSQSLANPFRITRPETARVTDGVEEVHHALSEVCLRMIFYDMYDSMNIDIEFLQPIMYDQRTSSVDSLATILPPDGGAQNDAIDGNVFQMDIPDYLDLYFYSDI